MDCLIHLLALCVFDPSNVYVTGGLEYQTNQYRDAHMARPCYGTGWCLTPAYSGPVGVLKVGVTMPISAGIQMTYGFQHRSYVNTGDDRGIEFGFVELTWRPFR